MLEKINETTEFLRSEGIIDPDAGIILGTGLGGLTARMKNCIEIDYRNIPNFPVSTVEGHDGKLIYGDFGGRKIVAMKGRFHYYEGYGPEQVSFPVRILKYLGIKCLFLSNAAGGVNPEFQIGDIMVITDHINLLPNPLLGQNDDRIGVRFPDMGEAYDKYLIKKALIIAGENKIRIHKGVYLATSGPTFETPAEYRYFRIIGADAVGMSTTPEVIVARHMNLPCFAVSVITDLGIEGKIEYVTHESVQIEAEKTESRMTTIMTEMIKSL
ncbi:MAG: purine-nucleoside phosphorylase [Bacteroidetes bacterium GWE2_41_25]|nr:MAG: purine-nucleoside phosphorylase [Bacteroidetes bacterium GWA2_40_15]OFX90308.1 MAG: purine-nucleoside phosphorylase [Bacteroidetes bacterium GWC2_40_22]OFX93317.1 MAG: purine-nucleoside phosphorylase [Bacteroidetes bacterium GWE2_41_25]HBH83804.1 purine-nucleoside phosphorylase [Bacteroidales bacterium]HBQ84175.1 purine-nucleoside phosphorylase [Bacteroidales bacterium]